MVVPTRDVISTEAADWSRLQQHVCPAVRGTTPHILLSISMHLYQSDSTSPSILQLPSFLFNVTLLSSVAVSFFCARLPQPPSATFIYSSQLSLHSIPPQSSTILTPLIHKKT